MKRFFAVVSTVLFVFALVSCGNLTLSGKQNQTAQTATGRIIIRMPAAGDAAGREAIKQTASQVTSVDILLENSEAPENNRSKINATRAELEAGIVFEVNPGSYHITINAYKGSYSEESETRIILYQGRTGGDEPVAVAAGESPTVTIDMQKYFILYDNGPEAGDNRYLLAQDFINQDTNLDYVDVGYTGFASGWTVPGKVIIGWKDPDGNEYDRQDCIPINGKQLPLILTAIWGEPSVSFSYNANSEYAVFQNVPEDFIGITSVWTVSSYTSIKMSEYNKREIPVYGGSAGETTTSGCFEDTTMSQNDDDSWKRSDGDNNYYFCGWSVNKEIEPLTAATYDEFDFDGITIVQPGDTVAITKDTTFYAVWADEGVFDQGGMYRIRYMWSNRQGTPVSYENAFLYYLKRALKPSSEDQDCKGVNLPDINTLFPQYQMSIEEHFEPSNCWTLLDGNGNPTSTFKGEGQEFTFTEGLADNLAFYCEVYRPFIDLKRYDNAGSLYFVNADTYPLDHHYELTLPTVASLEADYISAGATFPKPNDGRVFLYWTADSEDENSTHYTDGYTFSETEFAAIQALAEPLVLYPVYGTAPASYFDTKFYQSSDVSWNSRTAKGEYLALTVNNSSFAYNYSCSDTEFLKLKKISEGPRIVVEIWKYNSDSDTEGTKIGNSSYSITAVTEDGVKTSAPFLFTKEALERYYYNMAHNIQEESMRVIKSKVLSSAPETEAALNAELGLTGN